MDGMDGGSISGPKKPLVPPPRERQAIRRRVGAFIRARRKDLGLTLGEVVRPMGYTNLLCDASHKRLHVTSTVM
jgi:hypothetical protein